MKQLVASKYLHAQYGQSHGLPSRLTSVGVHNIFEQQVLETPDRVALVCGNLTLTYEQLNRRANRVAHQLLARGLKPETLVGISIPRSFELIVNILGVLKAGCAFLPLDPDYPPDHLAMLIDDSKVSLILIDSSLSDHFPENVAEFIYVDIEPLTDTNPENPSVAVSGNNLAYVMFTSGSTGRPKGVMIEHRSIERLVKMTEYVDFNSDNVFLQFAPISFDASTFEIWGALLNGSRLAIMPGKNYSLADLGNAIREYGVTTLWLTAGLFHLMIDERIDDLRPLRQLLAGGDVLSPVHVRKALDHLTCDLINGYGPTENTTFTCCYTVPRNEEIVRSIPIGKPITNTQVIILNEHLNPVGFGEVGELYIGGSGLARGYLNSPELTTERFIENPFTDILSSKLYRTGDLARFRPDGNIEFIGRLDKQVKIRGYRIELEEIEIVLARQPGVRDAIAVARNVSDTDKQLVVFVVLDPVQAPNVSELRKYLEMTLPEYMVPSFVMSVDALPLTPNGKVDRTALIEKLSLEPHRRVPFATLESKTERVIAGILAEILGTDSFGANDNFFDLGANSLQLARFHNRLQAALDPNLKIISLFQNPSVRSLAQFIGHGETYDARTSITRDRARRQRDAYSSQRRMNTGRG